MASVKNLSGIRVNIIPFMRFIRFSLFLAVSAVAIAQSPAPQVPPVWQMQNSNSTASLRGIDSVDGAVAWASGTGGTVLKTTDGGAHWQQCAVPDEAKDGATLDFRGVYASDAATAIVMASGPGEKSRLYKTTNGCKSWKLLLKNPDAPKGFFDSFWLNGSHGMLLGDPVGGKFVVFRTVNGGKTWKRDSKKGLLLRGRSLTAFAASNSSIARSNRDFAWGFVTGGKDGAILFSRLSDPEDEQPNGILGRLKRDKNGWRTSPVAVASGTENSGAFSLGYRYPVTTGICQNCNFGENSRFIAVGGDYTKPNESKGTAASSSDGGWTWTASVQPPHGYRSSVQWSDALKLWITAGANGSDLSSDDGNTWQPIDDGNWNALALPFVVGPNGSIARLSPAMHPAR
jgi:photosystem II stability/assembly factor-like uncharacterized protein